MEDCQLMGRLMWPMKNTSFFLEYSLKSTQDNLLFCGLSTEEK